MVKRIRISIYLSYIIYIAAVLFFCFYSFPHLGVDLGTHFLGIRMDRIAHFAMFIPYPFISWLTFKFALRTDFLRRYSIAASFLTGLILAALTEILQDFFFEFRQGDPLDFLADASAITVGVIIIAAVGRPVINRMLAIHNQRHQS